MTASGSKTGTSFLLPGPWRSASTGILSQKCTVFRDMMAASSPDEEETVDDHPAVRLHDDPQDLEYFVYYLYNGIRYDQYQLDFRWLG